MIKENITIDDFVSGNLVPVSDTPPSVSNTTTTQSATSGERSPSSSTLSSKPTERELELFKKFHASDFDPNSSMDKKKLEQLRQAAQQTGDTNENKLRSKVYNLQAKETPRSKKSSTGKLAPKKTPAIRQATAPASPAGGPTYYVRTGFNQYRPAVNADISSNQQLFMRNPNPVARAVYPYVKVDTRSVRRASPTR